MRLLSIPAALLILIAIALCNDPEAQQPEKLRNPRYRDPGTFDFAATRMLVMGDKLYFTGTDSREGGGLFCTDGAANGIVRIKTLRETKLLAVVGQTLFLAAEFNELWKSDGTKEGTVFLKRFSEQYVQELKFPVAFKNNLYFATGDDANGPELWRSDGTSSGTVMVKEINRGEDGSYPSHLTVYKDALYFTAIRNNYTFSFWKSDGTPQGTTEIGSATFGMRYHGGGDAMLQFNDLLYFVADHVQLYKSNGTNAGTVAVKNFSRPDKFARLNGLVSAGKKFFFTVCVTTPELWVSDGSAEGTKLLKRLHDSQYSFPPMFALGDNLIFSYHDKERGWELWNTDGSEAGTTRIAGIESDAYTVEESHFTRLYRGKSFEQLGTRALFTAEDKECGDELWITDGTEAGTKRVRDIQPGERGSNPSNFTIFHGAAYFIANDGDHGAELWRSDGTAEDTRLVQNIDVGRASSDPQQFVSLGSAVLFQADDGVHGKELWRSNGTPEGTFLLKDMFEGEYDSSCLLMGKWGEKCLYWARSKLDRGKVWISDGTAQGTVALVELPAKDARSSSFSFDFGPYSHAAGNKLHFFLARVSDEKVELWKTDGTEKNTTKIMEFPGGKGFDDPKELLAVGDRAYFKISGQLWTSDGGVAGTIMLHDFAPGKRDGSWTMRFMSTTTDKIIFSALGTDNEEELWASDGTKDGTKLVKDIYPPRVR